MRVLERGTGACDSSNHRSAFASAPRAIYSWKKSPRFDVLAVLMLVIVVKQAGYY